MWLCFKEESEILQGSMFGCGSVVDVFGSSDKLDDNCGQLLDESNWDLFLVFKTVFPDVGEQRVSMKESKSSMR